MPTIMHLFMKLTRRLPGSMGREVARFVQFHTWRATLAELGLLLDMLRAGDVFLDIGANEGVFSYFAQRKGAKILAFEPNPHLVSALHVFLPAGSIQALALSNQSGSARLRIPQVGGVDLEGYGTIEDHNRLALDRKSGEASYEIQTLPLDSLAIPGADFLKIDVEGHELAVLEGAQNLIETSSPTVIVESEDRHHPGAIAALASFFQDIGYSGFFLDGKRLRDLADFVADRHQVVGQEPYVYNFVFAKRENIVTALRKRVAQSL